MSFSRLPFTVRWIWSAALIMLLIMTAYRLVLLFIFDEDAHGEGFILLRGLLYDAGVTATLCAVAFGLTFLPKMHPYRHRTGKQVLLGFFGISGMLLAAVYIFDLIFLRGLEMRVHQDVWNLLGGAKRRHYAVLNRQYSGVPVILGLLFIGWLWVYILGKLHTQLASLQRAEEKKARRGWQWITGIMFAVLIALLLFTKGPEHKSALTIKNYDVKALQWNPVQTLWVP